MSDDNNSSQIEEMLLMARRDTIGDGAPSGPPVWLISFTDVIALMLTFFVLLYAMSNPEPEKWEKKIGITKQNTAQFSGAQNNAGSSEGVNLSRLSYAEAENLDYLQVLFSEIELDGDGNRIMTIQRAQNNLMLSFHKKHIDNSKFNDNFVNFFNRLTPLLNSIDNRLTLTVQPQTQNGFAMMQILGKLLKANGYNRSLMIRQADIIIGGNNAFAISLQPHDGRRINR